MSLFSNILPSVISKTGEWLDGVFGTPNKPTATTPVSGSTPQFAQGEDIITKGINLIKDLATYKGVPLPKLTPESSQFYLDPTMFGGVKNISKTLGKIAIEKSPEII